MDPISALREALNLNPEDDIMETDTPGIFIVERKKIPGMAGFCSSVPTETMEVYEVKEKNELSEESDSKPIATIDKYTIFAV